MQLTYDMLKEDFGHIKYKDSDFIIINRYPYYDSIYKGHNKKEFYKAVAVRLEDKLDEDNFVPAYELTWKILDNNPKCDWQNPETIEQKNFFRITTLPINAIF